VIIASAIGTNTLFAAIITALLLMTTVFVLLFHMVIAVTDFFTELFKRKGKFDYFRLINVFFSVTVNVFFMFFYFSLLGSAFIQILF
jgi:succinate dehydrogenase/fumarate reductase cytochrome b subunit